MKTIRLMCTSKSESLIQLLRAFSPSLHRVSTISFRGLVVLSLIVPQFAALAAPISGPKQQSAPQKQPPRGALPKQNAYLPPTFSHPEPRRVDRTERTEVAHSDGALTGFRKASTFEIAGGTWVDRDPGLIGTGFVFNPNVPGGTIDEVEITGPPGWNAGNTFICGRFQPPGIAANRAVCFDLILPVTGDYTARATVGGRMFERTFSIDATDLLSTPQITNLTISLNEVIFEWTASSAAQSFMVRVNLVPFTGTIEGEKVVSGASRSATLTDLVLIGGNEYQAVVWGFSQDVQAPGPIVGQFNLAFNLASDDNFFIAPLGVGIDLALVINGSGSISPTDFALQKDGIIAAIQDPLILPRDGSVGLTLIQYADATTQIHVPYTVIGRANVASVIAQVNGIGQIGGSTNPGDGINTANDVFNADGNAANDQVICLSTDGLPNAGADVGTAVADGKASPIGLDKFTVIAIENPPFFFADDFENFYGPFVFGKTLPSVVGVGTVTVVQDAVEFANTVGGCLTKAVQLIGVEVNQAIQDWNNSVELVTNKTTYVRAHIRTPSLTPTLVFARLHGTRNGAPLPGSPLTPENENGSIEVSTGSAQERGELDSSFYFRLPSSAVDSESWLNGSVDLEVEVVGTKLECLEAADTPNDCSVQVTFTQTDEMEVRFVAINWTDAGGTDHNPTDANLTEVAQRLTAIYPVDDIDSEIATTNWMDAVPPDLGAVLDRLLAMRDADDCTDDTNCNRLYYGVLVGPPDLGGLGFRPGAVSAGTMPDDAFTFGRNRQAHELAHNLGLNHAVNESLGTTPDGTRKLGPCGSDGPLDADDFPHINMVSGNSRATLGPLTPEDSAIFGFDTGQIVAVDPAENFELMSYCGLSWKWVSDFTYDGVRTAINNRFSPIPAPVPTPAPEIPFMQVRGNVDFDNDTANFLPFGLVFSRVAPTGPPPGDFTLELRDENGDLLDSIAFQPFDSEADFPAVDPGTGSFIIRVPADPAIRQVVALRNGTVLASRSASPNPPTVQVVFPNGSESLSGAQAKLEWTGGDPDGDVVTYTVQYSADGGSTWQTLVVDWPLTSYEISLDFLAGTSTGVIRVIGSDGFNAAADESDGPFSTPNNPPQVSIVSPANDAVFVGTQSVSFDGEAIDREDGQLTNTSLEWRSDKDGVLRTGENFTIKATGLSEGDHIITLTATDGGGLGNTASVNISVFRLLPPIVSIDIDIKPGSDPNSVNCNNDMQVATVAILTTEDFDATTVDHTTVSFEGAREANVNKKSGEPHRHGEDVDGDGDIDLIFHFRQGDTDLSCDSTEGTLSGETFDGLAITGTDAIQIIDKGGGKP